MTRQKRAWNAINRYAYKRWLKARHTKREYELFWLTVFYHEKMPSIKRAVAMTDILSRLHCAICQGDSASRLMVVYQGKAYCVPCFAVEYPGVAAKLHLWLDDSLKLAAAKEVLL